MRHQSPGVVLLVRFREYLGYTTHQSVPLIVGGEALASAAEEVSRFNVCPSRLVEVGAVLINAEISKTTVYTRLQLAALRRFAGPVDLDIVPVGRARGRIHGGSRGRISIDISD